MYELIITTLTIVNGVPMPATTHTIDAGDSLKSCKINEINIPTRQEFIEGDKVVVVRTKARCMLVGEPSTSKINIYEE